jgi:delta24(24(1))-sterol reductase
MPSRANGGTSTAKKGGLNLRNRTVDTTPDSPSSTTAVLDGKVGSAPTAEQVTRARKDHEATLKAQNTAFDHRYGHVDMRDDQIIGGGKEQALQKYTPGIVISEKGRELDKKMDQHYE